LEFPAKGRNAADNSQFRDINNLSFKQSILANQVAFSVKITKLGGLLRSNPQSIDIGGQNMSPEFAQRAQKFEVEDLDLKRIAVLVDELRIRMDRLNAAERQIREMGYSPE
jgi:hypothetical protein